MSTSPSSLTQSVDEHRDQAALPTAGAQASAPEGERSPTTPDSWTTVTYLHEYFERSCDRAPDSVAVLSDGIPLTYGVLDRRANQLAWLLNRRGVSTGDTVGILLNRSADMYVAVLAVLKAGAAYVPLDPSFPQERLCFIADDAELSSFITTGEFDAGTSALRCPVLKLDRETTSLASAPESRLHTDISTSAALSYVIYTSGSTGRPKGVAVSHGSIVNFVRVATPIYGVAGEDRVYQGMALSFDFHIEEMWPAWSVGATLIAGPSGSRRFGQELAHFLSEHTVTVLCSVPTLLTTIETDVPSVRCLLVSGESMPADLVRQWWRPGRRILNAYGPTETTISASCAQLTPDRPVTLGHPLPTYHFYILDDLEEVDNGATGEICIGGPGVAVGYLNRPDLTAERFITNPVERDRDAVPRLYRTGDLGRFTPSGELEYLGRIDTQVKVRGYRIELEEIEQVIREDRAVENAVVTAPQRDGVVQDLVGYVTLRLPGPDDDHVVLRERLHSLLRRRLPQYMVPTFIEVLDRFPLLAADKVDRRALPSPTSPPLGRRAGRHEAPSTPLESLLVAEWARILGTSEVSVDDDFFCDLGGHSLSAARLVSSLRGEPQMAKLAIGDLYANPTIRGLAQFVSTSAEPAFSDITSSSPMPEPLRHTNGRVLACGAVQVVMIAAWLLFWSLPVTVLLYAIAIELGVSVVTAPPGTNALATLGGGGPWSITVAAVFWFVWLLANMSVFPVAVSRVVLRGIQPGWYPLWGRTYLRFWFYSRVAVLSPVGLLAGTPLLPVYLRLLGAKVGKGCQLASGTMSLPPLIQIGDGVSANAGARIQSYYVQGGWLRLASVRIGDGAFLGTNAVVTAGAEVGDRATVGDQSIVHADSRIPAGEDWAGSPARRVGAAPPLVSAIEERRESHASGAPHIALPVVGGYLAALALLIVLPVVMLTPSTALVIYVTVQHGLLWGLVSVCAAGPLFVVVCCLCLIVIKRTVLRRMSPGIYPWHSAYGVRDWLSSHIMALSFGVNRTLYCTLYVLPFLRALGMRMGRWCEVATPIYVDPDMVTIGDQCFLAGGVTMAPTVHHGGYIGLQNAHLGRRSFVGNMAVVPGGSRLGDNTLLGVQSLAPSRPLEPETTWLGSPAIFLPRRQTSEVFPDRLVYTPTRGMVVRRLAIEVFRVTLPEIILGTALLVGTYATVELMGRMAWEPLLGILPAMELALALLCTSIVAAIKWCVIGRYHPRTEPYWSMWVRRTELVTGLFETIAEPTFANFLAGTPWAAPVLRLFGVEVGRRVWLATSGGTEFDLVHVGDDAAVGEGTSTQTHLFEDRVMKMSHVRVGADASVGTFAVVLPEAEVGPGASLDSLSLVMKGETLPSGSAWRGIPARPV